MEHIIGKSFEKRVFWSYEQEEIGSKAFIFDALLSIASDTVTSYRSDFYHDAFFLENLKMDKSLEFFYLFGDTGTTIIHKGQSNLSPLSLAMQCRKYSRPFVYKVELITPQKEDSTAWTIRFTCLATDQEDLPAYNERASFNYAALYEQRKVVR
jgi:hypothetical protein